MEFTGFPDLKPSDEAAAQEAAVPRVPAPQPETNGSNGTNGAPKDPTVDVTMRLTEGKQFFVNRIVFTGNTTTRDNVIRREMRLVEGGVFNTESLKYSIRRLNQLGYFEQIDEQDQKEMKVDKTPGRDNAVDVTLALEEQNRNQLTFGAGVSQYEGFFGQLAFQTANFLGRGESLTVSMQAGDRAQNYQLAFTEPFLFDRNITGGFDVYKRALQYIGYYTQKSTGGNLDVRLPGRRLQPHVHELLVRAGPDDRPQRAVPRSVLHPQRRWLRQRVAERPVDNQPRGARARAAQPVRVRLAADRRGRTPDGQQGRRRASSTTRSTTRSSRTRASG